ncbi:hypothetical protein FRC17_009794 [Serendipita sp. 399]|nr:hypothetical protein FRC17_009794 [Serendipita sp. 399]
MSETITTDWAVRIQCKMYEPGGGNFSALLYLFKLPTIQVPHDPNTWLFDPHRIGIYYKMVTDPGPGEEDSIAVGVVNITSSLLEYFPKQPLPRNALEPEYVVPFLKKNLYWAILDENGTVLDSSSLPSLEVMVTATPLIHRRDGRPKYGEPVSYPEVTRGKPGGARD